MQEFVDLANILADEARKIVREHFRTGFDVITKDDNSPVTIADRAIEARIREIIEDKRPQDGIYGEEYGIKDSQNGLTWVLDPIDGTKSFVIGRPTFGSLIALCRDGVPVLGVIEQGILEERWIGVEGQATTFNGKPVKTAPCASVADARICSTTPDMFKRTGPVYEVFENGCKMVWGGDCYMYGLLANGYADICIEASLSPYDFAALVPVVQGAGGKMCDWQGQPLTIESNGQVLACGDPSLMPTVLEMVQSQL